MDKKRIAFFANTYLPTTSGVVRSISTFRQAFTNMGHDVFIFAQHDSDYEDTEPFIFRYPAVSIPFLPNQYSMPIPVSSCMNQVIKSIKPDVIHSHHPFILGAAAADAAKSLNLPLVYTAHTRYDEYLHYIPLSHDIAEKVLLELMTKYIEKCQHIVTPSESIKQLLEERGVSGPITAVPTGIDVTPFREADSSEIRQQRGWGDDIVLISIGRLGKEKNFTTLIKAVAKIFKNHTNARLVIIGDGPDEKSLKELAKELGITNKVNFTGRIPYEDIPKFLKAADIFCFASVTETQGLVTMEAMAAGLPVVAVNATGTKDAVEDGKEGLLTENNPTALAQAIEKVIVDKPLREQFKAAVEKKVEMFDITLQANRMLDVYGQAAEDKKANRSMKVTL